MDRIFACAMLIYTKTISRNIFNHSLQIRALFVFQKSKLEYCHITLRDGPNILGNTLEEHSACPATVRKVISNASNNSGRSEESLPSHVSLDGSIHVVKSYMFEVNMSERTSNV